MIKKILSTLAMLLVVGGGTFYYTNSKDNYDASKYSASVSSTMSPGSTVDFTLPDQFDKAHTLSNDTKILLLTFSKNISHTIRDFLKSQPADYLSSRNAFYVADISPMPTVIRNAFAMPDLKKSNYPVLLMYDKEIAEKFRNDDKKDLIMVVELNSKKIEKISFTKDAKELASLLK